MRNAPESVTSCRPTPAACSSFLPGHNTHSVHATLAGQEPGGWQSCTVEEIHGLVVTVRVAGEPDRALAWHHRSLDPLLAPGDQVRLHRTRSLIEVGTTWLSVVRSGLN